jgi:hypothetical protein
MTLCNSTLSRSQLGFLSLLLVLSGCASGVLGIPAPLSLSASSHAEPDIADTSLFEANTGRGSVVVTAKVNGQPVAARVKVLDGSSKLEGATGESISLPAGTQRISVTVAETQALLDKPTQNLSVFVESGKSTPVDVTFRWAKVRLDVLVGGRSQGKVPVKLFRGGEAVAELQSGTAPQAISPGKYEADVLLRGRTIHVTGLVFLEGAEQTVPVRAQL